MEVDKFAEQYLFQLLNILQYIWEDYPEDSLDTDGGLALFTRDLAKIGQLFLINRTWNGRQLKSQRWLQESSIRRVGLIQNRGYGYYWNEMKLEINGFSETAIFAPGDGGQFVAMVEWIWKGTNTIGWPSFGIPATDKYFEVRGTSIMTIENSLIKSNNGM